MFKTLFKDSVVFGVVNAIQKLIPFFIIPAVIAYLGQDALRVYDVSFAYASLVSWLIILGQDAATAVLFFDNQKNSFDKKQVISYGFFLQLTCLLLFFCLAFPFSSFWSGLLFSKDAAVATWLRIALLVLPGQVLLNYALNVLLWQKRKMAYATLCLIQTALSIASVLIALTVFNGGLPSLIYVIISCTTITGLIGLLFIRESVFAAVFPVDTILVKKLFLLGIPFALTSFFHQLLPAIDRFFLIQYNYSQQMGPYVLAVKLGSLINFAAGAFILAFTPYSLAKLNDEDAEKEIGHLFKMVSIASFFLVPFTLLFKDLLIELFANRSFGLAANLLPFFFWGWLFDLFSYFSTLGIYRSQKSFLALVLFGVGIVVVSFCNLLLIPSYGLYGAAISFCVSKAFLFFFSLAFLRKHFHLQIQYRSFFFSLLIGAGCSYLVYVLPLAVNIIVLGTLLVATTAYLRKHAFGSFFKKDKSKLSEENQTLLQNNSSVL